MCAALTQDTRSGSVTMALGEDALAPIREAGSGLVPSPFGKRA